MARTSKKPDRDNPQASENNKVMPGRLPDVSDWTAYDLNGDKLPLGQPFVIG